MEHSERVALLALINQWRYRADHPSADEGEEYAQALRECAYDLERLLPES